MSQSQDQVAKQFVGTWRLFSAVQHLTDGTKRNNPLYGPGGVGYIIYGDTGRVCVVNINPSRPKWEKESAPTDDEVHVGDTFMLLGTRRLCRGALPAVDHRERVSAREHRLEEIARRRHSTRLDARL